MNNELKKKQTTRQTKCQKRATNPPPKPVSDLLRYPDGTISWAAKFSCIICLQNSEDLGVPHYTG